MEEIIHYPFTNKLGDVTKASAKDIKKIRYELKKEFPNAKRYVYRKPKYIIIEKFNENFLTYPEFIIYN